MFPDCCLESTLLKSFCDFESEKIARISQAIADRRRQTRLMKLLKLKPLNLTSL